MAVLRFQFIILKLIFIVLLSPNQRLISSSESSDSNDSDTEKASDTKPKNGHIGKKAKISNDKEKPSKEARKIDQLKSKSKSDKADSDSGKDTAKKAIKTTTVKDMLRAQRDSLMNSATDGDKSEKSTDGSSSSGSSTTDTSDESDDDADDDNDSEENRVDAAGTKNDTGTSQKAAKRDAESNGIVKDNPVVDVKLPDHLPEDLMLLINKIKDASRSSTLAKSNFFNHENMDVIYK